MDLEKLVLAVSVLFSRRVGSEDQAEVDRRCENIARSAGHFVTIHRRKTVPTFLRCDYI